MHAPPARPALPSPAAPPAPAAAPREDRSGLTRGLLALSLSAALSGAACAHAPASPPDDACGDACAGGADLAAPRPVREKSVALPFDPNGLFWDAATQALYIADDDGNQIRTWTEDGGLAIVARLPPAPAAGPGLGQIVVLGDRRIVAPRFGGGTGGDVVAVQADGSARAVTGLAPERRRLGLTVAADGTLYDSFFVKVGTDRAGAVAKLSIGGSGNGTGAGTETDVLTGLKKPIGVLALGDALYVSDQEQGQILKAPITDPATVSVFATLPAPDLLAAGPDGSIFTGGLQGGVRQISAAGVVKTVAQQGLKQVRGVAWDGAARRLFIANHDGDPTDGTAHSLEIVPID